MGTLTHKGYGRIYCENESDIERVKLIIKKLDEFEYGYLPQSLIAHFSEYPKVVYNGKFSDMDMDKLTAVCWSKGVRIRVFNSCHDEYPSNQLTA